MIKRLWLKISRHLDIYGLKQEFDYPGMRLEIVQESPQAQERELQDGLWLFLMSDAVLFGLAFASYVTLLKGTAGAPDGRTLYDIGSVFLQTMVLLASSVSIGLAALALQYGQPRRRLWSWLVLTLLLGLVFLLLEGRDLVSMLAAGGSPSRSAHLSAFWGLVPLHGLHVAAGCLWLLSLLGQMMRYGIDPQVQSGLRRLFLFWHFLDVVWIFIFTVVYLGALA